MGERTPMPPIPSVDAVEYGRRTIGDFRERMLRFEAQSAGRGDRDKANQWRKVACLLDMFLLGSEDGGCVITPFDQRWLDPTFRSIYEEARGQEVEL